MEDLGVPFICICIVVSTFSNCNDRRLTSSAGPTHPQPDGHYLLDSLGASQSRAPDYSTSGVYAFTRGRAQWYQGCGVLQLSLMCHTLVLTTVDRSYRGSNRQLCDRTDGAYPRHHGGTPKVSHIFSPYTAAEGMAALTHEAKKLHCYHKHIRGCVIPLYL